MTMMIRSEIPSSIAATTTTTTAQDALLENRSAMKLPSPQYIYLDDIFGDVNFDIYFGDFLSSSMIHHEEKEENETPADSPVYMKKTNDFTAFSSSSSYHKPQESNKSFTMHTSQFLMRSSCSHSQLPFQKTNDKRHLFQSSISKKRMNNKAKKALVAHPQRQQDIFGMHNSQFLVPTEPLSPAPFPDIAAKKKKKQQQRRPRVDRVLLLESLQESIDIVEEENQRLRNAIYKHLGKTNAESLLLQKKPTITTLQPKMKEKVSSSSSSASSTTMQRTLRPCS